MPRKSKTKNESKENNMNIPNLDIPPEAREKLEKIKKTVEDFKDKVLEKFDEYVLGMALLPPDPKEKEKIRVLILIDDMDSKIPKEQLKTKVEEVIGSIASKVDKDLQPKIVLLSLLWEELYDGHSEVLKEFVLSAPVYDKGMLAALRISELHKQMVIEKFEKYIVCYVLAGSLVQGKATPESDIDVFIVVDDTDVKRMTRAELKDKLRAIIVGMGFEAGKITGIENKLNIQVYILTDFWENMREANPVIFTFLRDGIPLYDRGIFMAWKNLLKMGRIKPSKEAIDLYKNSGEEILKRVELKLKEIGSEDFFWATLTPTQAAIMLYGLPPPTPKETPIVLKEIFVKKEKLLEQEYVDIIEKILKVRKDIEHGKKKSITGKEIDELLNDSVKYLERLKKLFKEIEERKEKERILNIYDSVVMVVRDALKLEGLKAIPTENLLKEFRKHLVDTNIFSEKYYDLLKKILDARKKYDEGKITKVEVEQIIRSSRELLTQIIEYIERKKAKELEQSKIVIKHNDLLGEVIFTDEYVFFIYDTSKEEDVSKAKFLNDGEIGNIEESNIEELQHAISNRKLVRPKKISKSFMNKLKEIFGEDLELIMP